jgi:hypothetical protein
LLGRGEEKGLGSAEGRGEEKIEEEEEDPWEKINQKTLALKEKSQETTRNAAKVDLNEFFETLVLLSDEEDGEASRSGFLESLCACIRPQRRPLSEDAKQVLKLSRV